MSIKYESVVPWGRSFDEYVEMFKLTELDLEKDILGCGDGPASFNSIMKQKGRRVVSVDPIYQFSRQEIENRIEETYEEVINQTNQNKDNFIWTKIRDVEHLGEIRMSAMREFLVDYDVGKSENRYVFAELPFLPFHDNEFDLTLSSHFLFLYSDNLSFEFHRKAVNEMLRVSKEIKIFPLLDLNAARSIYVNEIIKLYSDYGYYVQELGVDYEFQKGGNTMLRISKYR
ncbi:class I SAM-dependent methyltransferase [Acetivibrio cellulolyticus]|uniref:SAM-dependent methyltransferase n=1 Tax=Acetivibrio cellulolyticus TaxID=35830 RepID=UPI0001E2F5F2|nr:SAM-dependent methyltransferase [Acetivibrio cellulolyticus]